MIKYQKAGWIKFSNKFFPKYYKEHWLVEEINNPNSRIAFKSFENACIYDAIKSLRESGEKK